MSNQAFITCDNLVKIYKVSGLEVFALQGLDLEIGRGELIAIIGSSGSGKSTLLNIMGGLVTPTAGQITVGDWNLNQLGHRDKIIYKRKVIGFVWQNISRNLIPYLTALENVQVPMILNGQRKGLDWARELLIAVGLKDRMNHRPAEMSGGQQQRVAIAVGLANKPEILLADEPTGSLDARTSEEILQVFNKIKEDYNITVIVVTHDRNLAGAVDRAVEIRDGKIVTESINQQVKHESNLDFKIEKASQDSVHTNYTILDSSGRLQIPEEYLAELGIKRRVSLELKEGEIRIKPRGES